MKKAVALLIILLWVMPSAFAQCADGFLEAREIVLDQSTQLLGNVQQAALLSDGSLVVTTDDPGVFRFEEDGTFVGHVGGPAPCGQQPMGLRCGTGGTQR